MQTALITIEVHSRDVIEKLVKVGCASPEEFEWSSQLRFYWENNDVAIKQVSFSSSFPTLHFVLTW